MVENLSSCRKYRINGGVWLKWVPSKLCVKQNTRIAARTFCWAVNLRKCYKLSFRWTSDCFDITQGCFSRSCADGRNVGYDVKHCRINYTALLLTVLQVRLLKFQSLLIILRKIYLKLLPWNGIFPLSKMYVITPSDQMSHFTSYPADYVLRYPIFITSGAIYAGEPQHV